MFDAAPPQTVIRLSDPHPADATVGCLIPTPSFDRGVRVLLGTEMRPRLTASFATVCVVTYRDTLYAARRLAGLVAKFDAMRDAYIAASDEESWALARQAAVVVGQAQRTWSNPDAYDAIRDETMATNALWALQRTGQNGRIMLSAHNGHVASGPIEGGDPPMGQHLRGAISNDLVVIGQHFDHGSFVALEAEIRQGQYVYLGLNTFTVGRSQEGSINDALASTKLPLYMVDIRNSRSDAVSGAWWQQMHTQREIGALYGPGVGRFFYANLDVPRAYDVLLYTESSTAAATLCDQEEGFCIKNQSK